MKETKSKSQKPKRQPSGRIEFAFDAPERPKLVKPDEENEDEAPARPISRKKMNKRIVERVIEAVERL